MHINDPHREQATVDTSSDCQPGARTACSSGRPLDRRDLLKLAGLGAASLLTTGPAQRAVAGPFDAADFEKLVPSDKKLDAAWVRALFERGEPTVYRNEELNHIGMPVGGICCGQLYLGGDGRLWHWDIFGPQYQSDYGGMSRGIHYATPMPTAAPLEQGFALNIVAPGNAQARTLDRHGFRDVAFQGSYPIGRVTYRDPDSPVSVLLEAFSPFIPLNAADSSLPATVMHFTLHNDSDHPVTAELVGWLENAVSLGQDDPALGDRRNRIARQRNMTALTCSAVSRQPEAAAQRPEILFDDFETERYEKWQAEGTAFGTGPIAEDAMPDYQGDVAAHGRRLVNSHNARQGEDVHGADAHTGTLTSLPFTIERRYIAFRIGGGGHQGETCLDLLVDGKVVASATGQNHNRLQTQFFHVAGLEGKEARLRIVDQHKGGWGNIGVDHIVFTDKRPTPARLEELAGFGTLSLVLLSADEVVLGAASIEPQEDLTASALGALRQLGEDTSEAAAPLNQKLIGGLGRRVKLEAGEAAEITFVVAWYFPDYVNVRAEWRSLVDAHRLRREYARRFESAWAVAAYVADEFDRLAGETRLWVRTWYDSTLPWWLLDRTFLTIDCAATATCHWFDSGRFYGWEGVYCCPGTCQHVWNYAQGLARIFPELERTVREMVDYGIAYHDDGALDYRGEAARHVAHDGQSGTILRAYREHQMSADHAFLERNWRRIRKSIEYMISEDGDENGLLEGRQYNTLDAAWYGPMGWLSSLYLAAVAAGAQMAEEMHDVAFAARCQGILRRGRKNIADCLFNGEYFIHLPDPQHPEATNTNDGCHIDQVFGQSFAWQLGLPRVAPEPESVSALKSLWRYNFTPDIGPYREGMKPLIPSGRWYAMPGEGGLLMCTWPKGGADQAAGEGNPTFVGYFNECMTGFEYQVAAHMVWEGLVKEGLAVTRMIHDRYHAGRRNPWNEIECSDHYARAMASYGVFIAVCGYEYHGPRGRLGFAPRLRPDRFKAAFTGAEGWGSFSQQRDNNRQQNVIEIKWGRLRLSSLSLELAPDHRTTSVRVQRAGQAVDVRHEQDGAQVTVTFAEPLTLEAAERLEVTLV